MQTFYRQSLIVLFWTVYATSLLAQIPWFSPLGTIDQQVGNLQIGVRYERPAARGRLIFGGLVPWEEVWRTGAGNCTKISFDKAVTVGGQPVPASQYALLTIPSADEWMVILNTDTTLYGSRDYDADKDIARFRVKPYQTGRYFESLTIDIDVVADNAEVYLSWANTGISFMVDTGTEDMMEAYISDLLQAPLSDTTDYAYAAEYLLLNKKYLATALELTERQILADENEYAWRLRLSIFEYSGYPDKAREVIRKAIAFRQRETLDEQNQAWSLGFWREQAARWKVE
jgi:hypothetical protein